MLGGRTELAGRSSDAPKRALLVLNHHHPAPPVIPPPSSLLLSVRKVSQPRLMTKHAPCRIWTHTARSARPRIGRDAHAQRLAALEGARSEVLTQTLSIEEGATGHLPTMPARRGQPYTELYSANHPSPSFAFSLAPPPAPPDVRIPALSTARLSTHRTGELAVLGSTRDATFDVPRLLGLRWG
ncbi:hypothetical protein EV714DRAFT_277945 [Schizophyllum commune]